MPLVRIDVNEGRSPEDLRRLSLGIHDAILAEYGVPERDYFHILTEHPGGQIFAQDAGLGFERTPDVVMIQIFTQVGAARKPSNPFSPRSQPGWRSWGWPVRMCSSAMWRMPPATGRSVSGGRSTSPGSWRSRANSLRFGRAL